ncbi:MAG: DMT family transporter [Bacteroidales bacterium]|nr:DMT family transporter [Bacteroidales bacterium]
MHYLGESISLVVAFSWTITAVFAEVASKRLTPIILNVVRMILSLLMLAVTMYCFTGHLWPHYADGGTWMWLLLSGVVGYIFGDTCLFNAYVVIGSRFGQLFMTLAPPTAAILGFFFLGENMSIQSLLGMLVTLFGIGLSIMNRGEHHRLSFKLPLKGILYGIGAGIGQGGGLVLSKIGLNHYRAVIPSTATGCINALPFSATFIRAIAGLIGFAIILRFRKEYQLVPSAMRDKKGMWNALGMTFFGPFFGVSLSLMAVQYTSTGIASTIMALTPIIILLPAKFIFKQQVTMKEALGALISVVGVSLFFC